MNELLNCKGLSPLLIKKILQKPEPNRPRSMYIAVVFVNVC